MKRINIVQLPEIDGRRKENTCRSRGLLAGGKKIKDTGHLFFQQLDSVQLTRLLSAPSGGQGAGAIPCSVEGWHADQVGSVACQVFDLDPQLRQEESAQTFRFILQLKLPEVNLQGEQEMKTQWNTKSTARKVGTFPKNANKNLMFTYPPLLYFWDTFKSLGS